MTSLFGQSLDDFIKNVGATDPTPGGGSVAAITGALGCGLVLMAARISARKQANPALSEAIESLEKISGDLKTLAQEDTEVFGVYMDVLGLPKDTAQDKKQRQSALAAAREQATESPLKAARTMLAGLHVSLGVCQHAQSHVVSDALAGTHLLYASITATLYNVDINTVGQDQVADPYRRARQEIAAQAGDLIADVPAKL
ncbi:MAG: cyclodeaminase/cyclohydrolase family protein [Pseudomonadota bacterium]